MATPLRLAFFTSQSYGFDVLRAWAGVSGHEVVAVVTSPGAVGAAIRGATVAGRAGPDTTVLITPRPADAASLLADLDVDLGIIFGFTWLPDTVGRVPRHGVVNLHPSLLPEYRGPNPWRALYEGDPRLSATLHRIVEEYDAGPILAQASGDLPDALNPDSVNAAWDPVLHAVLDEGVAKAVADDPGRPQTGSSAKVATRFTDAEEELPWTLPARLLEARATALLLGGRQPKGLVGETVEPVLRIRVLPGLRGAAPGVVSSTGRRAIVAVADGVIEVELGRLPYA